MNTLIIERFLAQLGLTDLETKLVISLVEKGAQTTLGLSKNTDINRTKVYRLLEEMKRRGLVEEVVDENRRLVKAVDLHQLDLLVKQEESKAKALRDIFPNISSFILSSQETS